MGSFSREVGFVEVAKEVTGEVEFVEVAKEVAGDCSYVGFCSCIIL